MSSESNQTRQPFWRKWPAGGPLLAIVGRWFKKHSFALILRWLGWLVLPFIVLTLIRVGLQPLAFGLVLIFKWRVLATKYHWWWVRFRANIVDLFFGLAFVGFLIYSNGSLAWQLVWIGVYFGWQFWLKPKSSALAKIGQALVGQTIAISALIYSGQYPQRALAPFILIVSVWLVSYFSARHSVSGLVQTPARTSWPIIWGLFSLQLFVVLSHWQLWIWFIPQFVFLQLAVNIPVIVGYYLHSQEKLTASVRRQLVVIALVIVLAVLGLSDWRSQVI